MLIPEEVVNVAKEAMLRFGSHPPTVYVQGTKRKYQDQYESLQRLALEERMQGGVGSMSAMVREALNRLIKEKHTKK